MKLLIYAHSWAPATGGFETITQALAHGISGDRSGWEVTLATRSVAGAMNDLELPFHVVRRPSVGALAKLIRESDVVHVAGPAILPMILGIVSGKPVVVEHHGFQSVCPNGQLMFVDTRMRCPGHFMAGDHAVCLKCNRDEGIWGSFRLWGLTFVRRWLSKRAAANIIPTEWVGTILRLPRVSTVYHGLVQIEIAVSGQGDGQKAVQAPSRAVSASEEPPREQSDQRPGLPAGSPQVAPSITFGFCGRLVTAKGLHILLEAAHQLKLSRLSFRLLVVGDGVERPRLEAQTREYQLDQEVRFLGTLTGAPLDAALQATDAILMPSVGGEVFGLVALENMMRGKLVVVSDSRALTEVVGDAGLSCPEGDVAAWAACMERLIKNPALCREFSRRSRERAREFFSAQKMVAGHLAVYRTVLENSR